MRMRARYVRVRGATAMYRTHTYEYNVILYQTDDIQSTSNLYGIIGVLMETAINYNRAGDRRGRKCG